MMSKRTRRYVRPSGSELPAPRVKNPDRQRVRLVICAVVAKGAAPMPDPAGWDWRARLGDDVVSVDVTMAHEYCEYCGRCGPCDDDVLERVERAIEAGYDGELAGHRDGRGPAWVVYLTLRCQPGAQGATAWDWNKLMDEKIYQVRTIEVSDG